MGGTDQAGIAEWMTSDGKLDWSEAEKRLENPMFRYKYSEGKKLVHAQGSRIVSPSGGDDQGDFSSS
jgi:hypothetical protein